MTATLTRVQAKFGPLVVQDSDRARELTLNGQVQGGAYLAPGAAVVKAGLQGPGPVSTCLYSQGWLAAAAGHPRGTVLMVGLGSGAGPVSVLFNFSEISVDVVEIDPVMVTEARKWVPLLDHYIDQGRLRIHVADAKDFVSAPETKWDLLCSDGYTGGNSLAVGGKDHGFYRNARKCCGEIWLNWIGVANGIRMMQEFDALGAEGWSPERIYVPGAQLYPDLSRPRNWILTSEIPGAEALDSFQPYAALDEQDFRDEPEATAALEVTRRNWSVFLDSELTADTLAGVNLALA